MQTRDSALDLATLLALLWSPPDAAQFATAAAAHQRGQELVRQLGLDPVSAVDIVQKAAARVAAADYLPCDGPDGRWVAADETMSIAHPFTQNRQDHQPICLPSPGEVTHAIQQILEVVPDGAPTERNLALAVWRYLPDQFGPAPAETVDQTKWRPGEPVAHPAYPDSVWSVGAVRAATVQAGPEPAILFFSVASVQEYITQARRTQDLWMGSYLYAYFIWHAMWPIIKALGPWSILTPQLRGHPFLDLWLIEQDFHLAKPPADLLEVASLPNIFSAIVPAKRARDLANEAAEAMLQARDRVANAVFPRFTAAAAAAAEADQEAEAAKPGYHAPPVDHASWQQLWHDQIAAFFTNDRYWSVVPWTDAATDRRRYDALMRTPHKTWQPWFDKTAPCDGADTGPGFPLVGAAASRLLNDRKNRRDFAAAPSSGSIENGPLAPLCTLCASRVALCPANRDATAFWAALAQVDLDEPHGPRIKLQGRIRRGERLCGPCLMKRLALDSYFDKPHRKLREDAGEEDLEIDRHQFASTTTIATLPYRQVLLEALAAAQADPDSTAGYVALLAVDWLAKLEAAAPSDQRVSATLPPPVTMTEMNLSPAAQLALLDRLGIDNSSHRAEGEKGPSLAPLDELDGSWLIPTSYDVEVIKNELRIATHPGKVRDAATAFAEMDQQVREWAATATSAHAYRPPARYYAVLALDGDRLGKWLSGEYNPTFRELLGGPIDPETLGNVPGLGIKRPPGPLSQAAFVNAGRTFALIEAPRWVEQSDHLGQLIYAGGDDVLAMAPRSTALDLARQLAAAFRQYGTGNGQPLLGPRATISAAIVIAHHSTPLAEVMHVAHQTVENTAKETYGRDAFALTILKRSGPSITAGLPWRVTPHDATEIDVAHQLDIVRQAIADGILSRRLLADLRRSMPAYGSRSASDTNPDLDQHTITQNIAKDLERLAHRHVPKEDDADRAAVALGAAVVQALSALFAAADQALQERVPVSGEYRLYPEPKQQPVPPRPTPWQVLTGLLQAAEFLAREDAE